MKSASNNKGKGKESARKQELQGGRRRKGTLKRASGRDKSMALLVEEMGGRGKKTEVARELAR